MESGGEALSTAWMSSMTAVICSGLIYGMRKIAYDVQTLIVVKVLIEQLDVQIGALRIGYITHRTQISRLIQALRHKLWRSLLSSFFLTSRVREAMWEERRMALH